MDRLMAKLAAFWAVVGGIVLTAVIILTCVSIAGRALIFAGFNAVPGDYEVLEVGVAFAIFCFLPYCQLVSGHATVDIFTAGMGVKANRFIIAFWEIIYTAVFFLIAWRLYLGFLGKLGNGSTSMLLQFPIWWAYAAALVPAFFGTIIGVWCVWQRIRALFVDQNTMETMS